MIFLKIFIWKLKQKQKQNPTELGEAELGEKKMPWDSGGQGQREGGRERKRERERKWKKINDLKKLTPKKKSWLLILFSLKEKMFIWINQENKGKSNGQL